MNINKNSVGLLGICIGMGAVFSLAPINPAQAALFDREIINVN